MALTALAAVGASVCLQGVPPKIRVVGIVAYAGVFWLAYQASLEPWSSAFGALAIALLLAIGVMLLVPKARRSICYLALFGLLVAFFSGGRGAAQPFQNFLSGFAWLSPEAAEAIVIGARKTVHLTFYGSLMVFGLFVARGRSPWPILAAFLWALAHAVFDETRQMGVAGRSGSWWDVLLDVGGMLAGFGVLTWIERRSVN